MILFVVHDHELHLCICACAHLYCVCFWFVLNGVIFQHHVALNQSLVLESGRGFYTTPLSTYDTNQLDFDVHDILCLDCIAEWLVLWFAKLAGKAERFDDGLVNLDSVEEIG